MEILNAGNFESKINDTKKIVLLDFFATWCGPCKMLSPILEDLKKEYENIDFYKVDVDESRELAAKYHINSMPTLIFLKNGKEIERFIGWRSKEELSRIIENIKE